jgi:hypothetical protein
MLFIYKDILTQNDILVWWYDSLFHFILKIVPPTRPDTCTPLILIPIVPAIKEKEEHEKIRVPI